MDLIKTSEIKEMELEDEVISLTVIDREGTEHNLEAPTNMALNLMEVCKAHDLPVEGTCGGMALCASCHVYVLSNHELPEPSEDEEDMLDQAFFVEDNSRLCCQIRIKDEIDNIKVQLAPVS
jgi:2Fe-2S ferredoxin